jgi:hypothetical protein
LKLFCKRYKENRKRKRKKQKGKNKRPRDRIWPTAHPETLPKGYTGPFAPSLTTLAHLSSPPSGQGVLPLHVCARRRPISPPLRKPYLLPHESLPYKAPGPLIRLLFSLPRSPLDCDGIARRISADPPPSCSKTDAAGDPSSLSSPLSSPP